MEWQLATPPVPPRFDWGGYIEVCVAQGVTDYPVIPQVWEHEDRADERVIAAFIAIENRDERFWIVRGLLARAGSSVFPRQVTVEPYDPRGEGFEVTSHAMRRIRFGEIVERTIAHLDLLGWMADDERARRMFPDESSAEWASRTATDVRDASRGGRPRLPDAHFAQIARDYIDLHKAGVRQGILRQIAERESQRRGTPVSWRTARSWVERARDLGYLGRGDKKGRHESSGRMNAVPGPRLLNIDKKEDADGTTTDR